MLMLNLGVASLLAGIVASAPPHQNVQRQAATTSAPSATIDSGVVIGTQTSIAGAPSPVVNQYLGVPFAASPTRFAPAQSATPWSSAYMATQRGPACIQQFNYPESSRNFTIAAFNTPAPPESEDCLSVNIFVPAGAQNGGGLKPVMFWIYGGSLQFGYNGQAAYDGSSFAANQDVIVVATNYRTNARNLGYLDQRFSLKWVQRNIRSFGGDPSRVTIFGESAGSFSVDSLVTSFGPSAPDGPPPFNAAIMQSGQSSVTARLGADSSSWTRLISQLNCTTSDDLACARAAPATTLKSIIERGAIAFRPTLDNYTQLQYPEAARRAGNIARVPIMTGTNANEGILFTFTQNDTVAYLRSTLPSITDAQIQVILSAYPIGQAGISTQTDQIARIYTDVGFQCPSAIVANDTASARIPAWRYYYNATFANIQPIPGVNFGPYHASEIPIVFGTYPTYNSPARGYATQTQARLSELMQNMWATFAKNPTGGPAPGWNGVIGGGLQVIGGLGGLDSQGRLRSSAPVAAIDGGRCEIWRAAYGLTS
ncbi:hypothetical protein LTR51_001769 [Lithohypha guttulata]|nr:hypothetical protein LTR51_001769 [Lithohypha guttulata]